MKKFYNSGQSLVEVVVGLALAILVLGGLINAVVTSLRNSNFAKNQAQATKLAQQMIEQTRIIRDQMGWEVFNQSYDASGGKCYSLVNANPNAIVLSVISCTATLPDVPSATTFKYVIKLYNNPTNCSDDCKKVTVSVFWADAACSGGTFCHESELISYLSKWK